ncbi:unnamed protein product, partial [Arabidopsis halleri]
FIFWSFFYLTATAPAGLPVIKLPQTHPFSNAKPVVQNAW